ncbi:hypothetical protein CHS0354_015139, partial [Potamilus streckersoni]
MENIRITTGIHSEHHWNPFGAPLESIRITTGIHSEHHWNPFGAPLEFIENSLYFASSRTFMTIWDLIHNSAFSTIFFAKLSFFNHSEIRPSYLACYT